ncbi:hypothetical protein [Endozoicomonas sp. YOMI1]|uniref:hypothetical protein n=1 Tax=Endozoicomonas sp. YOMI1 TaxID=2828739 RepID=UPI002147EA25|nr:hypothetical protein [Endozoicomonas sp. YOMI1]
MIQSKPAPLPPLVHFKAVLKANSETERMVNSDLSTKIPDIEYQPANHPKKIKEYKNIESITEPLLTNNTDKLFACIVEKINELINKDTTGLIQYLNDADTVKEIKSLNAEEKSKLTWILFKDLDRPDLQSAIASQTGQYLVSRPTSDQFMVGFTGSLIEDSGLLKQAKENSGANSWLDVFRAQNASHLPESSTRKLSFPVASENQEYFGLGGGKATKNIAKSCPICRIPQTVPGEHNKIFHPDGFVELGPNHKLTTLIYSKDFLAFMAGDELTAEEKARLFPPALCRLFNENGMNFSAFSESALILPEAFLSPALCQHIDALRDFVIQYIAENKFNGVDSPDKHKALTRCYRSMIEFSTQIPVLARVGAEIEALLKVQNIPKPIGTVADRYYVQKFSAPIPWESIPDDKLDTPKRLLALNMSQRLKTYSFLAGNNGTNHEQRFFQREQMQGIVRKAMNKVCADSGSDLRPGSAPIFIGFIPPFIANAIARQHGFLDNNWAGSFLHGKYSHSLALTCLANLANLNQTLLKTIVDEHLWTIILDQNPYNLIDIETVLPNFPFLRVNPRAAVANFATSPFKHQQLLTTGQLSVNLKDIARVISIHPVEAQGELLQTLARRMGMDDTLTLDKLQEITENIRVLEMVLSTKHLNSMEAVYKVVTASKDLPEDWKLGNPKGHQIGNIPPPGSIFEKIKVKKYFHKDGYQIKGIVIRDKKNMCDNKLKLKNITNEEMIESCDAFIVFPPDSNTNKVIE